MARQHAKKPALMSVKADVKRYVAMARFVPLHTKEAFWLKFREVA